MTQEQLQRVSRYSAENYFQKVFMAMTQEQRAEIKKLLDKNKKENGN